MMMIQRMRNILFSKRSLRNLVSISHKSTLVSSVSTTSLGKSHFQAIKPILLINHSNFSNVTKPKSQRKKSKTSTISPPAYDTNVLNSKAISKVKAEKPSQIIAREELLPSLDKKEKDSKIDYSTNPLTRYLIDKLGYKTSQLLNSYSYQGFFEISVDRFKRYRELLISNNLPEKLIVKYGYVFIIDNFKSFKKQVEMLVYLKERLEIEKENEIFDILETNGYFLLQTKEEIQKKIDIFLKEISIASIIDVKKSMIHRRRMWLKSSTHFQNILQILQKEYHYTENELLAWFLYGKGKNLLSEKIFIDAAERKLIFEDLYGKDCFALKKSLRSTILSYPQLLSYPVSHYYSIINRFMEIFSLHDCTQMKWLPISIYNMGNIDRIEKRVELMYKYFTNGQELMKDNLNHHHHNNNNTTNHDDAAGDKEQKSKKQKSLQLLYKVDRSRYEEKQRELDRLYPMKLTVTTPQDDEPSTVGEGVEDGNSNNNDLKKASSYNMNPIDEERLYQDYVASKTNKKRSTRSITKQPQSQEQEQENIYDKFVQDSLQEYSQQGMLEILTETQDYSSWQQHLEKKLSAVNLTMNDLYRELWKESEGIEMTSKETLTIIQSPSALSSHLSNPILKVGMMTVFLGLERNEAMRMLRIMNGMFQYSIENRIFPRLTMLVPVVERYLHRQLEEQEQEEDDDGEEEKERKEKKMKFAKYQKLMGKDLGGGGGGGGTITTTAQRRVLRHCLQLYREHPIRKELRAFLLRDTRNSISISPIRLENGIKEWELSMDANDINRLFHYALAQPTKTNESNEID